MTSSAPLVAPTLTPSQPEMIEAAARRNAVHVAAGRAQFLVAPWLADRDRVKAFYDIPGA